MDAVPPTVASDAPRAAGSGAAARSSGRAPGRPRSERVSRAITEAALQLLVDGVSVDSLSMESIAARAGVGKAALYRRWPNKEAVLLDALGSVVEPPVRPRGEGVRQDLTTLVAEFSRWLADSRSATLLPRLLGTPELHGQYLRSLIEPKIAGLRDVLCAGVRDGSLTSDSDVDVLLTMLVGAVLSRVVLGGPEPGTTTSPAHGELAARTVDHALRGHEVTAT